MQKLTEDNPLHEAPDREQLCQSRGHVSAVSIPKKFRNFRQGSFQWDEIPMFAVLTGINGAGKTQLFNAIVDGAKYRDEKDNDVLITFSDGPTPYIYQLFGSDGKKTFHADGSYEQFEGTFESTTHDLLKYFRNHHLESFKPTHLNYPDNITLYEEIFKQVSTDSNFIFDANIIETYKKLEYHLRLKIGIHISEICKPLFLLRRLVERGFITIAETNKLLSEFKFKYKISENFQFKNPNDQFEHEEPSLGQMLHFMVLMWKIYSKLFPSTAGKFVLLLDEPDAHLHPHLTYDLVNTLLDLMAGQHNIQIIMTTHRPTTLCLVPNNSIWVLEDKNGLITVERKGDRRYSIAQLTSDLVSVNEKFRIVFVEASDDAIFYNYIWNYLIRSKELRPAYQVLFKSHGDKRRDKLDDNSSCDQVIRLVNKMVVTNDPNATLVDFIFGIIDNDMKEQPNNNNLIIPDRYAIENYVFDPLNLFFFLNHIEYPSSALIRIQNNLQHLNIPKAINDLPWHDKTALNMIAQAIADEMTKEIIQYYLSEKEGLFKAAIANLRKNPRQQSINLDDPLSQIQTIDYIGGIQINYPQMFIQMRGKQLKHIVTNTFLVHKKPISMTMIISYIPKIGMLVPVDLLNVMKRLNVEIDSQEYQNIAQEQVAGTSKKTISPDKEETLKQQITALEAKVASQKATLSNKNLVIANQKATIKSQTERIAELEALLLQQSASNTSDAAFNLK